MLKEPVQREWINYPGVKHYGGLIYTTFWSYVESGELKAARFGRSPHIHLPSLWSHRRGFHKTTVALMVA
jgi:hypothetical protein